MIVPYDIALRFRAGLHGTLRTWKVLAATAILAAFSSVTALSAPPPWASPRPGYSNYRHWASNIDWSGSDAPFISIVREVDGQYGAKMDSAAIIAAARRMAETAPNDAPAQFRWAYAIFRKNANVQSAMSSGAMECSIAMGVPPNPKSYVYDRMRFIIQTLGSEMTGLKPAGDRLLARNPHDEEVRYRECVLLACQLPGPDLVRALSIAKSLRREYPQEPRYIACLAFCHWVLWMSKDDEQYGDAAIADCHEYLRSTPVDDLGRGQVEGIIHHIGKIRAIPPELKTGRPKPKAAAHKAHRGK